MTALPAPGAPDAVYLVDLPGLLHRHLHGRPPVTTAAGERVEAVCGVVADLRRIVREQQPAYLAVAVESPRADGPETWRHELFPDYKATRRAKPRDPALSPQEALARDVVAAMGIPVLEAPGFEADDAIAAGAARAVAAGLRVVIVASDKDLGQLVSDHVVLWELRPAAGGPAAIGPASVRARWGVGPELVGDLLALAGDAGDDVPGVPGIGAGKAAALLQQHGRLERVLRNAGGVRGKIGESLRTHLADAVLSRRLVTLRYDALIAWNLAAMRPGGVDLVRLLALLERVGVEAEGVSAAPKEPVPTEALARGAAWWAERARVEIEAAWVALDEAIAHRDPKPANVTESFAPAGSIAKTAAISAAPVPTAADLAPALDPAAAPPSWRDHVAWPALADERLDATPVGRWTLLVGRWALLARATPEAPTVLVRVLGDVDPRPVAEREFDSRPRSRVEVWCDGVAQGEHEIPNRTVDIYVTDEVAAALRGSGAAEAAPEATRSRAPSGAPAGPTAPTAPVPPSAARQASFGW